MKEARADALHVAVIGAGIVGACISLELLGRGHRVTLVETAEPGGEQAASYGNGAFLSPASVIPMSTPDLWRKLPGYLLNREGPLSISLRALPRLTPWLCRFLISGCSATRVRKTASALNALIHDAPARHLAIAARIGRPDLVRQDGLLYVYPDRAAFSAEALAWRIRGELGLEWTELDAEALHRAEPALSRHYGFGALVGKGASCSDPAAYVRAIVAHCEKLGLSRCKATALDFDLDGTRLSAVHTDSRPVPCDRVVIAAGMGSCRLAGTLGEDLPLEAERGYHVEIPDPGAVLRRPILPSDGKMANTMIAGRLRSSGQVELACHDATPNWHRCEVLLNHLRRTFPGLNIDPAKVRRWQGNRPSTPDGLPVISASSRCAGVFHASGHGHIGLNAAAATAEIVADLIEKKTLAIPPSPYGIARFRTYPFPEKGAAC